MKECGPIIVPEEILGVETQKALFRRDYLVLSIVQFLLKIAPQEEQQQDFLSSSGLIKDLYEVFLDRQKDTPLSIVKEIEDLLDMGDDPFPINE